MNAPPGLIWPWIVQIGFGRAGWYAYDLLDNLGRPSAKHTIPEPQQIRAGDVVPIYQGKGAPYGVGRKVKAFEAERWMLSWDDRTEDTSWVWALYPVDKDQTRLIMRVRIRYRWTKPTILFNLLVESADPVMMGNCFLDIKQRESPAAT